MEPTISNANIFTRYIYHRNRINRLDNSVKYTAFLPSPNGRTSVFLINNLQPEEIWNIGGQVGCLLERQLHGRADIIESNISDAGLSVHADNIPPRHANIIGWPGEQSEQILIALQLASHAQLHLR